MLGSSQVSIGLLLLLLLMLLLSTTTNTTCIITIISTTSTTTTTITASTTTTTTTTSATSTTTSTTTTTTTTSTTFTTTTTTTATSALRSHLFSNNIWPFEQLGTVERTFGAKEAILFDRMINKEVRLYKRNLYVGWTDVRKAYDSIYQEFIIDILQYIKAPKWIIQWVNESMKTWRTILQVRNGKECKPSKEIEIGCGIFQGDFLSPTLFCIAYFAISYQIRNMKLGKVPGPHTPRDTRKMKTHVVLMDDLKIYTTGEKPLEKVINELTDTMK